jgi:hypothetical protein
VRLHIKKVHHVHGDKAVFNKKKVAQEKYRSDLSLLHERVIDDG